MKHMMEARLFDRLHLHHLTNKKHRKTKQKTSELFHISFYSVELIFQFLSFSLLTFSHE